MTQYLVRHRVQSLYASQDDLLKDWRALRRRALAEARWLSSLYAAASGRLYCVWESSSPEAILACFLPAELEMAPIEKVEEVVTIDPAWLDEIDAPEAAVPGG
jgi:hypothetical protein